MTRPKCKCPPGSPFHWRDNPNPSMFARDSNFKAAAAALSHNQTMVVEREREKGRDISHIAGLSAKHGRVINVKQFTIYSRAGIKL